MSDMTLGEPGPSSMEALTEEERTWPALHRARRVIMVVDMVESVRLMQKYEDEVVDRWRRFVGDACANVLPRFGGRMVKSLGDGMLLDFEAVPRAVAAAFELRRHLAPLNSTLPEERVIHLRTGLHVAEVIADELDVYGAGVNLAARVASIARPDGIAASEEIVGEILPGVDALIEDAGRCYLKHLDEPVHVYHLDSALDHPLLQASDTAYKSTADEQSNANSSLATCVALVPIAPSSGSDSERTITELLSDLLLTRLATVRQLKVISRLSTEQFRIRGLEANEIARLCGASYLVSGRLHGGGNRCHLYLELIDAEGGAVVWADSIDLDAVALLKKDEAITESIAASLVEHICAQQVRRVSVAPLPNLASQTLQFSAIQLMHRRSLTDFGRAFDILEHLVYRHPRASAPHAWLAQWHVLRVTKGWGVESDPEGDRALSHSRRATDLNSDCAMSLAMEAFVHCHIKHDLAAASQCLDDALAVNTSEPWVWLVRSTVLSLLGKGQESWQCAMRARALSPMDPLKHYFDSLAASAAVAAERYEEARYLARLSLSKDSRHLPTLRALAIAQVHLGQTKDARDTVSTVLRIQPDFNLTRYVESAPRGGEEMRRRWAEALREAGAPQH